MSIAECGLKTPNFLEGSPNREREAQRPKGWVDEEGVMAQKVRGLLPCTRSTRHPIASHPRACLDVM